MANGQVMKELSFNTSIDANDFEGFTTANFSTPNTKPVVRRSKEAVTPASKSSTQIRLDPKESTLDATDGEPRNLSAVAQIDAFPPITALAAKRGTFLVLQEWEGHVVSIEHDAFVAHLIDLTAEKLHESEEATVPIDELSDRDAANLTVGGIFRWVIGYERSPEGTRKRVSQIVFRDLPRMTEGDFQSGREWANRIAPALNR